MIFLRFFTKGKRTKLSDDIKRCLIVLFLDKKSKSIVNERKAWFYGVFEGVGDETTYIPPVALTVRKSHNRSLLCRKV